MSSTPPNTPPRPDDEKVDPTQKKNLDTPSGKPPTPKTPPAHTANNPPQVQRVNPVTSIHEPLVHSPSQGSSHHVEMVPPMTGSHVNYTPRQQEIVGGVGNDRGDQQFQHMRHRSQRRQELRRLGQQVRFGQLPQNNEPRAGVGLRRSPSDFEARRRVDEELNSVTGVEQQIVELQEEIQSIDIELYGLYQEAADLTLLEGSQHTGSLLMNPVRINRLHNIQNQINGLVTRSDELRQFISELRRGGMSRHQRCEFGRERREYNNTTLKF